MALVVEDGSGVSGADTFATVAEFDADCLSYFGASVSGTDPVKEAALRRAFVFMGALPWVSGLWPIFGGVIPAPVRIAQSVLARVEAQKVGALSPDVTLAGGKVLTEVKGVKWQVLGDAATVEESRPVVTMAMDLLKPWLAVNPAQDKHLPFVLRSIG
jgi:hypothetical protein